jgi:beta-galactosidase
LEKNYPHDLKAMVEKDYNHPSVVMYSIGNEVSETAQKRGIDLCAAMTECLHALDSTRKVTCGINIFFNFLSSMGFGVYSDKKAERAVEKAGGGKERGSDGKNAKKKKPKKKAVGSEFFNNLAGIMGADFMKWGATLPPCDWKTRDAFAALDVAGYNYGINRYAHDLKTYPKRLILGSETFCCDAWRFWQTAEKNVRIIGDFVWAGMDYLGEVGIGAWEYEEYASDLSAHGPGWVAAGAGRIDLTGKATAEARYMQVVYGTEKMGIAVVPVPYAKQRHSPSAWRMTNAVESWSWNGCDGTDTKVEVYSKADYVELYVNETLVGKKKTGENCKAVFDVIYHDGRVKAVACDSAGSRLDEIVLETAGEKTVLTLEPEMNVVHRDDLCYMRMKYTDTKGNVKPLCRGEIKVSADGGKILGTGSACPYYDGSYLEPVTDTYYGEAVAIIKPGESDTMIIHAESKYGEADVEIRVV